jgi:hypothetical protein
VGEATPINATPDVSLDQDIRKPPAIIAALLSVSATLWTTPTHADEERLLTGRGLGAVRFGMTEKQIERSLGAALAVYPDSYLSYDDCETAQRKDGRDPDLWFMLEKQKLTRIDIYAPRHGHPASKIRSTMGIGLGTTEETVKLAFGKSLDVEPHADFDLLKVLEPAKQAGLIFETVDGKVDSFRSGLEPSIEYSEGCE